jgi:hypothetical protein
VSPLSAHSGRSRFIFLISTRHETRLNKTIDILLYTRK